MAVTQFNISKAWIVTFFLALFWWYDKRNSGFVQETKIPGPLQSKPQKLEILSFEDSIPAVSNQETTNQKEEGEGKQSASNSYPIKLEQGPGKHKAAFVVLVRNDDVYQMKETMRMIEETVNKRFKYDWVFMNDQPFSKDFVNQISSMTSPGHAKFEVVPKEHWGFPEWVDVEDAREKMKAMEKAGVIYGGSESYRHMCRFESGFFFRQQVLKDYDYYWRIEPETKYYCIQQEDPFEIMDRDEKKYAFTISFGEYMETIPSLWQTVKDFIQEWNRYHPDDEIPRDDRMWKFVTDDDGESYNGCHFWSNFEIGNLNWFRSEEYLKFFDHLDKTGNFFYERWGDAPVHTLATVLFLKREELWFADPIGYHHPPYSHCPLNKPKYHWSGLCSCNPNDSIDKNSCVAKWFELDGDAGKEEADMIWNTGEEE